MTPETLLESNATSCALHLEVHAGVAGAPDAQHAPAASVLEPVRGVVAVPAQGGVGDAGVDASLVALQVDRAVVGLGDLPAVDDELGRVLVAVEVEGAAAVAHGGPARLVADHGDAGEGELRVLRRVEPAAGAAGAFGPVVRQGAAVELDHVLVAEDRATDPAPVAGTGTRGVVVDVDVRQRGRGVVVVDPAAVTFPRPVSRGVVRRASHRSSRTRRTRCRWRRRSRSRRPWSSSR